MRRFISILLGVLLFTLSAFPAPANEHVPYDPDEFPQYARDARRFQIITLGSFPLTMLFTTLFFRTYRLLTHEDEISWAETRPADQRDRNVVLGVSLSASAIVGVTDYVLGLRERSAVDDD